METPKTTDEQGPVYEVVAVSKQKEAVDFLNRQLFTTPVWLINQDIFSRTGLNGVSIIGGLQDNILNRIMGSRTLTKLLDAEATDRKNAYQMTEFLSDLRKGIWGELAGKKPIDIYRRNLQKSYINILSAFVKPSAPASTTIGGFTITTVSSGDKTDIRSVVAGHLTALRTEINAAAAGNSDLMTRYHLLDVSKRIDNALNPK